MQDDLDLDGLFAKAAERGPLPSAALLARIEADARREQPRPMAVAAPPRPARGWGMILADVLGGGLGGGRGLAGLSLAAASGLWIGVAQPTALSPVTEYLTGTSTASLELLPSDLSLLAGE
ncbi:dihydroorotate dehydrogenase [Stagnihabitans tardus]|uniref:Dihydroorotate dehydrogenase n=1 Tax=Stagnihabitans tardus TaxID=2699202 RepID=A0AAE4YCH4_9RHOB|nr:dihydroorotate dehydrogenase [Stagnihabitans tardus]NBZ87689.1 dihydroorotate dehydrogenase [Stagnihabitans tardus]